MIAIEPIITDHAYRRAEERLDIGRLAFRGWVTCTWREWLRVSSDWLSNRNVRCTDFNTDWYASPWTAERGVAIAMSADHHVRTVIDFDQRAALADNIQDGDLVWAVRSVLDGLKKIAATTGFTGSMLGHSLQLPFELYREGRIDAQDLAEIVTAPKAARNGITAARTRAIQKMAG